MQAAHGDGIIQWAASAVSAPSAMVMYEQTTLWRHLDFIPLGLAFKTMCHVPLLLLFHNIFDATSFMYCISSFDHQQLDMGWITVLVSRCSPHIPHKHACSSWAGTSKSQDVMSFPTRIQTLHQEGSLSHVGWICLVIQTSTWCRRPDIEAFATFLEGSLKHPDEITQTALTTWYDILDV